MSTTSLSWNCPNCGFVNDKNVVCAACFRDGPNDHRNKIIEDCRSILKKYNQEHVFDYLNDITSNTNLNKLLLQIYSIDFEYISNLYKKAMSEEQKMKSNDNDDENKSSDSNIKPFPHSDAFNGCDVDAKKLSTLGYKAIVENKCCVIILAGGQGTRLGFNKPKGCYNINLPSKKSIYQIQIEKVLAIKRAACQKYNISEMQTVKFPIYFMTSDATHTATKNYLNINSYFKYDYFDIKLFKQNLHPCFHDDGKFIMKSPHEIAMSPNGNGGIYSSLKSSGIYADMLSLGIEYIQIFGIDNILARIGDPLWFGHFIDTKADSSNKTCIKHEPHEKVGVMCLKNGNPAVTEYTELTTDMVELKQTKNDKLLEYCYANLAMHLFHISHIKKICDDENNEYQLPIHVARKKIPFYDSNTKQTVKPETNNGVKLEFFVFDTYQYSKKCTVFNILREEEFAPVKNASGNNSAKTARLAHSKYWKKQILANGGKFENESNKENDDKKLCEISPLFGYLPYDDNFKKQVNGNTFRLPLYLDCE